MVRIRSLPRCYAIVRAARERRNVRLQSTNDIGAMISIIINATYSLVAQDVLNVLVPLCDVAGAEIVGHFVIRCCYCEGFDVD